MSVQLRIVHSQWNEIRKAIQEVQRKFTFHDHSTTPLPTTTNTKRRPFSINDTDYENVNSVLFLKDTTKNARRNFYLSKRRRELSHIKDQQFYEKLELRKQSAQDKRILYSNIKSMEKVVRSVRGKPSNIEGLKSTKLSPSRQLHCCVGTQTPTVQKPLQFWQTIKTPKEFKESITQGLKRRLVKRDDIKLDHNSFCYESIINMKNVIPVI